MEIKEIKAIIDLMKKNDLTVFKIENNDFKLTLEKDGVNRVVAQAAVPGPVAAPAPAAPSAAPETAAAPSGPSIDSPMVGTFYSSPSPDSPAYVKVGDKVTPDTVVCIVEAMKVMNEIKAETSGTIAEISVENGKPVQYGEPLFRLK